MFTQSHLKTIIGAASLVAMASGSGCTRSVDGQFANQQERKQSQIDLRGTSTEDPSGDTDPGTQDPNDNDPGSSSSSDDNNNTSSSSLSSSSTSSTSSSTASSTSSVASSSSVANSSSSHGGGNSSSSVASSSSSVVSSSSSSHHGGGNSSSSCGGGGHEGSSSSIASSSSAGNVSCDSNQVLYKAEFVCSTSAQVFDGEVHCVFHPFPEVVLKNSISTKYDSLGHRMTKADPLCRNADQDSLLAKLNNIPRHEGRFFFNGVFKTCIGKDYIPATGNGDHKRADQLVQLKFLELITEEKSTRINPNRVRLNNDLIDLEPNGSEINDAFCLKQ